MSCGTLYTKVYNDQYFYSLLTHSVAVALIIWHFTQDKIQTIAGLFHDIATSTFKHCIDFMNGDSEHQESTEERTEQIIKNSKEIYIKNAFKDFQEATRNSVYKSDIPNNEIYCTSVKGKKRYINPLVSLDGKISRIKDVSLLANSDINNFLNMKLHKYIGFNFDFKPYNK